MKKKNDWRKLRLSCRLYFYLYKSHEYISEICKYNNCDCFNLIIIWEGFNYLQAVSETLLNIKREWRKIAPTTAKHLFYLFLFQWFQAKWSQYSLPKVISVTIKCHKKRIVSTLDDPLQLSLTNNAKEKQVPLRVSSHSCVDLFNCLEGTCRPPIAWIYLYPGPCWPKPKLLAPASTFFISSFFGLYTAVGTTDISASTKVASPFRLDSEHCSK